MVARVRGARRFVAGGTDLVVKAKDGKLAPATWIDVAQIRELRGISETRGSVVIGAATPYTEIIESKVVRRVLPALVEACAEIGSVQIRNMGTLGGNLANASPAADGVVPLVAYDAEVVIQRGARKRVIPAVDIATGPGRSCLGQDELITEIRLAKRRRNIAAFLKLGPRASMAIAKVSLALVADLRRGRLSDVRIALGAVAPTVIRATHAEAILEGNILSHDVIARARVAIAESDAIPITDFRSTAAYRRAMCAVLLGRALRVNSDDVGRSGHNPLR